LSGGCRIGGEVQRAIERGFVFDHGHEVGFGQRPGQHPFVEVFVLHPFGHGHESQAVGQLPDRIRPASPRLQSWVKGRLGRNPDVAQSYTRLKGSCCGLSVVEQDGVLGEVPTHLVPEVPPAGGGRPGRGPAQGDHRGPWWPNVVAK